MRHTAVLGRSQLRDAPFILPPELFVEIFGYLVNSATISYDSPWELPRTRMVWLLRASKTCREWRRIIFSTPRFWTIIDVGRSCAPLEMALERSSNLPVDIRFHDPAPIPFATQLLSENAHRIRALIVVELDPYTGPALTPLLSQTSMPLLEELWINTQDNLLQPSTALSKEEWVNLRDMAVGECFALSLQPDRVPKLRALHMTDRCFDWSSPIMQRLRALYLGQTWSVCHQYGCFDDFLNALESCHSLEFLKIDGSFPLHHDELYPPPSPLKIASLPQLKRLCLRTFEAREIHRVLCRMCLELHASIDIHVLIGYAVEYNSAYRDSIATIFPEPSSVPHLQSATRAVLNDLDFECWGPGGCGRLAVAFEGAEHATRNGWAYNMNWHAQFCGGLLAQAPLTHLTIHQHQSMPIFRWDLGMLLRGVPDLLSLEYDGLRYPNTDLPAVLDPSRIDVPEPGYRPDWRSGGWDGVMVPQLRRLVIVLDEEWPAGFLTSLADSLRTRAMVGLALDELSIQLRDSRHVPSDHVKAEVQFTFQELKELVRGTPEIGLEVE